MTPQTAVLTSILPLAIVLVGLGYTVVTDSYISRIHKKSMILVLSLTATLIAQNVLDYYCTAVAVNVTARILVGIYGYSVRPALIVLFYYFVGNGKKSVPAWIMTGVNATVYLTALFSHVSFTIADDNSFVRGPLGYTCHVVTALLLANLLSLTIHEYGRRKKQIVIPVFCVLLIVGAVVLDSTVLSHEWLPVTSLTVSVVLCCVFYYIWLHLQFVREHERDLMAEQRIKIMVSQIQPHFLFNTIATFRALCKRDPDRAADVAEKFGAYLRQNLDSLDTAELIPLEKEIEHTRLYADIEMERFENVRVEYDVEDGGFSLPPLTVQPIVENAIRHGVRARDEGVVRVSARLEGGEHVITVSDNGVGFDVGALKEAGGDHIGVANVRERVEKQCGGTLSIESAIGEGTTVTIRIPQSEVKE